MSSVVILTALGVEYQAVRDCLQNLHEETDSQGTVYERGKFVANEWTWDVGIAEVGMGDVGAAVATKGAIEHFKPELIFFVGIAGGIKDVKIGDVVAARKIYGYESGKVREKFFPRPEVGRSAYALVSRAKAEVQRGQWLKELNSEPKPQAFVAPIAAGEKVIASKDSELFQFLRDNYSDAIAVEMEGAGFLTATFGYTNIKAIVIRGISDLIDGKNDDSVESETIRQERASRHASAFAFEMLKNLNEYAETPKKYRRLEALLQANDWYEADKETAQQMLVVANRTDEGWLNDKNIDEFPCEELHIIDRLWVKYSQGRFGFSVQNQIYQGLGGTENFDPKVWKKFGSSVGWLVRGDWSHYHKQLTFSLTAPQGHLPVGKTSLWMVYESRLDQIFLHSHMVGSTRLTIKNGFDLGSYVARSAEYTKRFWGAGIPGYAGLFGVNFPGTRGRIFTSFMRKFAKCNTSTD